ncbi:MAG: hypothetical protein ACFFD7_09135 [Candidatus Thorarchaeota archaeon]
MGGDEEAANLLSMLATSMREALVGGVSSLIGQHFSSSDTNTQTQTQALLNALNEGDVEQSLTIMQQGTQNQLAQISSQQAWKSIFGNENVIGLLVSLPGFFMGGGGISLLSTVLDLSTDVIQSRLKNYYLINMLENRLNGITEELSTLEILNEANPAPAINTEAIDISPLFRPKIQTVPKASSYPSVMSELGLAALTFGEMGMAGEFNKDQDSKNEANRIREEIKKIEDKQDRINELDSIGEEDSESDYELNLMENLIEEKIQVLQNLVDEILKSPTQEGSMRFVIAFKNLELRSSLEAIKQLNTEDLRSEEVIEILKQIDPNLDFSLILASRKSKRSTLKEPNGKVISNRVLNEAFKTRFIRNLESSTYGDLQELQKIRPKAYIDIKNYLEKSTKPRNSEFAEKYLKGSFIDLLLTYYVKYEIPAQIWSTFLENDFPKSKIYGYTPMEYFGDKYISNWDNDAKRMQRIIWAVLLDFRNPYNGEKIKKISDWMSLDLHHWMTGKGVENKYKTMFAAVVPLPISKSLSSFVHNDLSLRDLKGEERIKKGVYWENEFADRLSKIFQGEAPISWDDKFRENFNKYQKNLMNKNARKLISWFLLNPYSDVLKKFKINPSTL